jgi:hypothetical protein
MSLSHPSVRIYQKINHDYGISLVNLNKVSHTSCTMFKIDMKIKKKKKTKKFLGNILVSKCCETTHIF